MNSIAAPWGRTSIRALAGLGSVVVALLLVAAVPAPAGAETASESLYGPSMRLTFADPDARLVGAGAVVSVRCVGPVSGSCTGTVSMRVAGAAHKVAFSVLGGRRQQLVVPLGADRKQLAKKRATAVARTMQPLGSDRHQRRVLRLK